MSDSLTNFTLKLLEYGAFSCGLCKETLTAPIRLVENLGNVCNKCYKLKNAENPEWLLNSQCLENTCIELILNELHLPCKYKNKGCDKVIGYRSLDRHEKVCSYSPVTCPLNDMESCLWTGCLLNVVDHFKDSHAKHMMESEALFKIETDFKDTKIFKCLSNGEQYFFLKLWIEKGKIKYFLCAAEDKETLEEYRVKHVSDNGRNTVETKGSISGAQAIFSPDTEPDLIDLDLDSLKTVLCCDETMVSTFEVVEKMASFSIKENIDHCIECPVCSNLMSLPIQLCQSGHSICSSCASKLMNCPTCREPLRRSRNYALEHLISKIEHPCRNVGCTEKMSLASMDKHEAVCNYKSYQCPITDCFASINLHTIKTHIKNSHKNVFESNMYRKSFNITKDKFHENHYLLAFGKIFRLTFNRTDTSLFFDVEIMGENVEDAKNYQFKIQKEGTYDSLWSQRCSSSSSENKSDDFFKKCSKFENYYLQLHAKNDIFTLICRISRRKSANNTSFTEVV